VNTSGGAISKSDDTQCTGIGTVSASASDLCNGESVAAELIRWSIAYDNGETTTRHNATGADVTIDTELGSPGEVHTVTFSASDGCGNTSTAVSQVTFGDEKAPTPICISGVTTAFMSETGDVAIWANDFDLGSFDNCTDVHFSIVPTGDTPAHPDSAAFVDQASITFDCEDASNLYELDLYVWDASGNTDYCTVQVLINGECDRENMGASITIAGQIETEYGDHVDEVIMTIESQLAEYPKSQMTTEDGLYSFQSNPTDANYRISAKKDVDPVNGVTTLDIVHIQKHILGTVEFDNDYKYIAADANGDQKISAADIIQLRRLILGVQESFIGNESWRFVDRDQDMTTGSPWPFVEIINIISVTDDQMSEDFIAVKIGDINGNATANAAMRVETRSVGSLMLLIDDVRVQKGDRIEIPVRAEQFDAISGFQFTIETSDIVIESIQSSGLEVSTDNYALSNEGLSMSWHAEEMVSEEDVLFIMTATAQQNGLLSDMISLTSTKVKAEAYQSETLNLLDVEMDVISPSTESVFALYQNEPNPFITQTKIGFDLPQAGTATLSILDADGKIVKTYSDIYESGYNEIRLERNDINVSGVVFYQLESGEYSSMMKMIILD